MLYFNWNHSFIVPARESCQRSDKGIVMIDNSLEQVSHLTHAGKSSCISSICGHYEDKRSIKKRQCVRSSFEQWIIVQRPARSALWYHCNMYLSPGISSRIPYGSEEKCLDIRWPQNLFLTKWVLGTGQGSQRFEILGPKGVILFNNTAGFWNESDSRFGGNLNGSIVQGNYWWLFYPDICMKKL